MKLTTTLLALVVTMATSLASQREGTEWTNVWIPNADTSDKPRVLLVGDSITQAYYEGVAKSLSGKAYVAKLTTSLCVCDPAFEPTLLSVLAQAEFSVIHFNNGLHGVGYSEDEYRAGYERALRVLREQQPKATLIIALSTPLKQGSNKADLNPRVDVRNATASDLAKEGGFPVNDLHRLMKGHPEYYKDPYHFHSPAIRIQTDAVSAAVRNALAK